MYIQRLSRNIEAVTNSMKTIKEQLQEGKLPDEAIILFVTNNITVLSKTQQNEYWNVILPKLEQMRSIDRALVVRKNNPFLKLPIIRSIRKYIRDRKREKMLNKMHIKEGIPSDKIETMKREERRKYLKRETVVISDLHGKAMDKWEYVRLEIINNPFKKFIILGEM